MELSKFQLHVVQSIVHDLKEPVVSDVVRRIEGAYEDILPGLPQAELPAISISGECAFLLVHTPSHKDCVRAHRGFVDAEYGCGRIDA